MTLIDQSVTMKRCNRCHRALPVSDFNTNPNFRDGLHGHCRICQETTLSEIEAILAARDSKVREKLDRQTPEEAERLRQRNLQYRRTYLAKKRIQVGP